MKIVRDFSRNLVRGDTIATWPCLDDLNIIWRTGVYSGNTTCVRQFEVWLVTGTISDIFLRGNINLEGIEMKKKGGGEG